MTPKQKAENLLRRYLIILYGEITIYEENEIQKAKECALVALEEMENSHIGWATEQGEVFDELDEIKAIIKLL